ncbi:MAG: hypothetical protein ACR2MY_08085 [Candidatus Dormibacteria bacterium]
MIALLTVIAAPSAWQLPAALTPLCADASDAHHASVVVTHLSGAYPSPVRTCVAFSEGTISGGDLLRRSGVEAGFSGAYGDQGSAVCQVDNEPASYPPNCLDSGRPYWSVWTRSSQNGWQYSRVGVDAITIHDGDSEGFRLVDANHQGQPDSPGGVCPPPRSPAPASPPAPPSPPAPAPTPGVAAPPRPDGPGGSGAGTAVPGLGGTNTNGTSGGMSPQAAGPAQDTSPATASPASSAPGGTAAARAAPPPGRIPAGAPKSNAALLVAAGTALLLIGLLVMQVLPSRGSR